MSVSGRVVYVVGAGIAGLTLALALAKFGARVVVLERQAAIQEFGAGLQISPNARKVLDRLGLSDAMTERAFEAEGIDVYPLGARHPLVTLELGAAAIARYGAPYAVMHRADLAEMLYRATKRFANIDVLFGVKDYEAVPTADGVSIVVHEADGKTRGASAFALIGADGVHSRTRRELLVGPNANPTGRVAWRATLPLGGLPNLFATDRTSLLWAPGMHAVIYPMPARGQINVVMFSTFEQTYATSEVFADQPRLPGRVRRDPRFAAIMKAVDGNWTFWPLATVSAPHWHKGPIGLVGDAAHAMVPFQAQGAAMSIEDAAVLAPLLMRETAAETALERYEQIRRPRVERVQKLSAINGDAFHMAMPFSLARDLVVRTQGPQGHFARLDWVYGHEMSDT